MITTTLAPAPPRGDEEALYRRHHRNLQRAVARVVNAPRELIEDACQTAWTIMLRSQPDRAAIFSWLRVVAIHEAYRLSSAHRAPHLEDLCDGDGWDAVIAGRGTLDDAIEARRALERLAELPPRQRRDLALRVAGFTLPRDLQVHGRPVLRQRQRAPAQGPRPDSPRRVARGRGQNAAPSLFMSEMPSVLALPGVMT